MKITVDHGKCMGNGLCEATAPQVFALDEDGKAVVVEQPGDSSHAAVEQAERLCPTQAIAVHAEALVTSSEARVEVATSTVGAFDPRALFELDQDALRCPHTYFEGMRAESPVYRVPDLGFEVVTRYADIMDVVRNPDVFSSSMPTGPHFVQAMMEGLMTALQERPELQELAARVASGTLPVLLNADPPTHSRQRALVNRAFSPKRVQAMEAGIRAIADDLIDRFADSGRVELVHEFAVPLPLTVIADALGVPREDLPTFKRWSDDFVVAIGNPKLSTDRLAEMMMSQAAFADYFTAKIEERRAEPRDDLISDVVMARIDGEELTTQEMLGMFSQFLVAGNETTTKMIAGGMRLLLEHPDVMADVRSDPSLIPNLVEEVLRLESPVQGLYRVPKIDTEIGGVPVKAGTPLMCAYASGNRDSSTFEEPARLDVHRANAKSHLAFSQGPHYCLGASLARAEGRIAFEALLERLDDIRLAGDEPLVYEDSYVLHGLKELRLQFSEVASLPGSSRRPRQRTGRG